MTYREKAGTLHSGWRRGDNGRLPFVRRWCRC